MTPVELLLSKLPSAKPSGNGWSAKCPAHDDDRASLSVSAGDDGRALVKCFAGCTAEAVCGAVGLKLRDLMPERPAAPLCRKPAPSKPAPQKPAPKKPAKAYPTANDAVRALERANGPRSNWWTYQNAAGEPVGLVVRWDRDGAKDIRPVARVGDGWRICAMPEPRPLYQLPELAAAKLVLVTEGEKCANAVSVLGFTATTSAGGSQAAARTDWQPLAGKEVWVLPDNDAPGRKYAAEVVAALERLAPAPVVRVVELPNLPDKGDVADWIDAHPHKGEPDKLRAELETLGRGTAPHEPDPPDDSDQFRPFPVAALPEPVRGFVTAGARAIGCDPSFVALPVLVALAAAVGNTRRLELKRGWHVAPILWAAVVGESGTTKTPAFQLALRAVRVRESEAQVRNESAQDEHFAELAQWEKEQAAWKRAKGQVAPPTKPKPPRFERYTVGDTTVEALAPILRDNPRGVLLARDELSGWFGSFDRYASNGKSGADESHWLSMYNAESMTVDRKTGPARTLHVPAAAVCVVGGIQPAILERAFDTKRRESGLAARFLLAYPPRRAKAWTEADIEPKAQAAVARVFAALYELRAGDDPSAPYPLVRLSADARALWTDYYTQHNAEQVALCGELSAAWSKLEEYAARLALVLHFVRWAAHDSTLVDVAVLDADSMRAGIVLAEWFKREARRVYAMLDETDDDRDTRELVEFIRRKGGAVTAREVQQGYRPLKAPGAAEAALEALVKAGRGTWRAPESGAKGGRPTREFVLSVPAAVYETPETEFAREGIVDVDSVDAPTAHAATEPASEPEAEADPFPFGFNNPDDPDGERLFANPPTNLPD